MTTTLLTYTDASMNFTNAAGSGAGSWANVSDTGSVGGSYKKTTVIGDKVTITWTGRALYLLIGADNNGSDYTVTTDGVLKSNVYSCSERNIPVLATNSQGLSQLPILIDREITDGVHTTVIQGVANSFASGLNLYINGYIAVTGSRIVPDTSNRLLAFGDSWTVGTGGFTNTSGYIYTLQRNLSYYTKKAVPLTSLAVAGTGVASHQGGGAPTGVTAIVASAAYAPSYITFLYGTNDLNSSNNQNSAARWLDTVRALMYLISDIFDTTKVKVFVGTPGFISDNIQYSYVQYNNSVLGSSSTNGLQLNTGSENAMDAVRGLKRLVAQFPDMTLVDVYRAMNRRMELVNPSAAGDYGIHPNNSGHGIIAEEFMARIVGAIIQSQS